MGAFDKPSREVKTKYPGIYQRQGRGGKTLYRVRVRAVGGSTSGVGSTSGGGWRWLPGSFRRLSDAREAQVAAELAAQRVRAGLDDPADLRVAEHRGQVLGVFVPCEPGQRRPVDPAAGSTLDVYARHLEGQRRKAKTIREKMLDLNRAFRHCELATVGDLPGSGDRLALYLDGLIAAGKSARWRNKQHETLHAFFEWARKRGVIKTNPVEHVRPLNEDADVRHPDRALSPEELRRLVETTRSRHAEGSPRREAARTRAVQYLFLALTGLRWTTMRQVTWSMVHLDEPEYIDLPAGVMKTHKAVVLPLSRHLAEALRDYAERLGAGSGGASGGAGGLLFETEPSNKTWKSDLSAAGIEFHTAAGYADKKCLRSTFATWAEQSGAAMADVSRLLDHSDPKLTMQRYARIRLADLGRVVEGLDSFLDTRWTNGGENSSAGQRSAKIG